MTADSGKPTGLLAHTYMYLSYTAPGTYRIVKRGIDNFGEVGSSAVYQPF